MQIERATLSMPGVSDDPTSGGVMSFATLQKRAFTILRGGVLTGVSGLLVLSAMLAMTEPTYAIPAFARKYGLPCSACHEAWPKLNNFGQVFKDSGYQLGNERDTPITQHPAYFPITVRITPQWRWEHTKRMEVDSIPGGRPACTDPAAPSPPNCSTPIERSVSTSGFDLSGLDLWMAGTLAKNISFLVLPAMEANGAFGFEAAWVRFDNLLGSPWLNLKFGKHELDTPISQKRFLALSENGGFFQLYRFSPIRPTPTSPNPFAVSSFEGIGNNQLGIEVMGHSRNSYTRYAFSVLSSNSGNVGLPTNRTYDYYLNVNQAFELPRLGLQRVGAYVYYGQSPTYSLTLDGAPIAGTGRGNKPFWRAGVYGIWYAGKFDFSTLFLHGMDNVFIGTGTPSLKPPFTPVSLPTGARSPTWNGGFVETHYTATPQLLFLGRYELIRVSRQALDTLPGDLGNIDALTFGYRWYPFMHSRAGLAWHMEYSRVRSRKTAPLSGLDQRTSSLLMGWDFDF